MRVPALQDSDGKMGMVIRKLRRASFNPDRTPLRYEGDVLGIMDVELACEFRGPTGTGIFDLTTLRLVRKGPPANRDEPIGP